MIVLTTARDELTQKVALKYGAHVLETDSFTDGLNTFDVGLPYSLAFRHLSHKDWVVLVGADIILYKDFRAYLESLPLDKDDFYGCDRINLKSEQDFFRLLAGTLSSGPFDSKTEWGFGYFQLFNYHSSVFKGQIPAYPQNEDLTLSDYYFRSQFGSGHRVVNGVWTWDGTRQHRLSQPCFHLDPCLQESKFKPYLKPKPLEMTYKAAVEQIRRLEQSLYQ